MNKKTLTFLLCILPYLTGCSFFGTKDIKDKVHEILDSTPPSTTKIITEQELPIYENPLEEIKEDSGAITLYYHSKSINPDQLKEILEEQIQEIKISILQENNQLIIRDETGTNIPRIRQLLEKTDKKSPQIMLEARIYSIFGDFTQDFETELKLKGLENIIVDSRFPGASVRAAERGDMGFKIGFADKYWEAAINVLRSYGYAEDIATPNLLVKNRGRARIKQVEEFPIREEIFSDGTITAIVKYKEIPTSLEIIPYVLAEGYIGLNLKIALGSRSIPQGPTQAPIIEQKEVEIDDLILKTGQTLIIAGLTTSSEVAVTREIPYLGNIPILGIPFKSKDYEKRKRQIIFQITPYIIDTSKMENR